MAKAGWAPTASNYLGRVTKTQILAAIREAKGDKAAERIAALKKPDMVDAAEELLAGTGRLPKPLCTPVLVEEPREPEIENFGADDHTAIDGEQPVANDADTAIGQPGVLSDEEAMTVPA
ncbi:MAG: hypothetical protein AAF968_15815 [Pseudomonadota bacterium]